ncbi:MAG: hypothetical protein ABIT76_01760 [Chthoniobacterales bacterium]
MTAPRLPSPSTGKKDYTFIVLLLVSVALHVGAVYLGAFLTPTTLPPVDNSLDIEIVGEENEPPPLGTNDIETGPPPAPETTPPPPEPEETPPPPVVPQDFAVPEEALSPTPAATPKPKVTPKPQATPSNTTKPAPASGVNPNARPGAIKGVDAAHGGVAGGTGAVKSGGRADFISTPNLIVPYSMKQRLQGMKASASASIIYSGGTITEVNIIRSSGNSAMDALVIKHVRSNYRVKSGAAGKITLPIGIRL